MWDDRWILGRDSDKQITGELRTKSLTRQGEPKGSYVEANSLLKLVDLLVIICQLCRKYEHKGG